MRAAFIAAVAMALLGATKLSAQEAPRAHTVKRGDTLWDLAKLYLGDSFLWPEIYRLNTDVIDDPHWIYPGEMLKLPGPDATPAVAETPPVPETPPVKQAGEPVAPPPTAKPNAAPVSSAAGTPVYEPPIGVLDGPNVFPKARIDAAVTKQRAYVAPPKPAVKLGTFLTAPFVDRSGGPRGAGTIIRIINLTRSSSGRDPKARAQLHDELLVSPPVGSAAPEGQRYVTYEVGEYVEDLGQIVIPTGVIEVTRSPRDHESVVARVVRMFGEIHADQLLMPYDSTALHVLGRPEPVADSLVAKVKFLYEDPILPSIQNYLAIDLTARDGIRIGDEFLLYEPRHKTDDAPDGLVDPEIPIARAQVVRVTQYGTTLMIIGQEHPKINVGTMARRVAMMP